MWAGNRCYCQIMSLKRAHLVFPKVRTGDSIVLSASESVCFSGMGRAITLQEERSNDSNSDRKRAYALCHKINYSINTEGKCKHI